MKTIMIVAVAVFAILTVQLWQARRHIAEEVAKNAILTIAKDSAERAREAIEKQNERQQDAIKILQNAKRGTDEAERALRERLDTLVTKPSNDEAEPDATDAARGWIYDLGALDADINRMLERETSR